MKSARRGEKPRRALFLFFGRLRGIRAPLGLKFDVIEAFP